MSWARAPWHTSEIAPNATVPSTIQHRVVLNRDMVGGSTTRQQSVFQSGLITADGPDVGGEADAGRSSRPSSRRTDPPFGRRQPPLLCDRPPQRLREHTGGAGKCAQEARIHEAAGSGVEDAVGAEIAFDIGRLMQI